MTNNKRRHPSRGAVVLWEAFSLIEYRLKKTLIQPGLIDSRTQMHYRDFITALENLGIREALYCDMGSGWNYSWYRNEEGKPVDIIGTPWPFSHNWLVFRK